MRIFERLLGRGGETRRTSAWLLTIATCAICAGGAAIAGSAWTACGSGDGSAFANSGGDADAGSSPDSGPSCPAAQAACGNVCVDIQNDPKNCGTCGATCGTVCCAGVCQSDTPTCAFSIASVGRPGDPSSSRGNQSGGDYFMLTGAGFSPGMKVFVGDGLAPSRVLSSTSAIFVTPAGPAGAHDLTIVAGASKATLKGGFTYQSAGMSLPWQEKPMATVRGEDPGLAVLQDGRVLIVGGTTVPDDANHALTSAEIYTRTSDSVSTSKGTMAVPRWHSSAVTMLTGKVLVVGGAAASTVAELYDPKTDSFAATAKPLAVARSYARSVLMADGRVMVTSANDATSEIYDPDTDTFSTAPLHSKHAYGFIVRLRDGRVMVGGGDATTTAVEIFDATTSQWKTVAPLNQGRSMLTAHTLPDGRVMVLGGASISAGGVHVPLDTIELYDPAADKWTIAPYKLVADRAPIDGGTGPLVGRTWHASALVRDGTVLVMGGYPIDGSCTPTATVDQVDPVKGTVVSFGTLPRPNTEWTAVTLQDGSVLGVGGGACGTPLANPSLDFLPGAPIPK